MVLWPGGREQAYQGPVRAQRSRICLGDSPASAGRGGGGFLSVFGHWAALRVLLCHLGVSCQPRLVLISERSLGGAQWLPSAEFPGALTVRS